MTLSLLALCSVLFVPLLLGAGLVQLCGLRWRDDPLAYPVWCALAGGLGTAALVFAWSWLGWPYDARLIAPLLLGLGAACGWLGRRTRRSPAHTLAPAARRPPRLETAFLLVVVLLLTCSTLVRVLRASSAAIALGDEASIWTRKAQLLFDAGGLNDAFGARALLDGIHLDYPLLNPLLQVWTFAHARTLLWVEPRFPIQVFALALVLAQAAALRRVLRPGAAAVVLVLVYFVDASMELTYTATSDLMVALGVLVAADAGLRWMQSRDEAWARLFFLALAFSVGAKNEGALLVLCFFAAGAVCVLLSRSARHRPRLRLLAWAALPLVVFGASWLTNLRFGFRSDIATASAPRVLVERFQERIGPLLAFFSRLFFLRPRENAGVFAALIGLGLLAPLRVLRGRARPLTLLGFFALAGWTLVYLSTPHDLEWHMISSGARVTYQMVPTLGLWLALVLAQDPWVGRFLRRGATGSPARG